MSDSTQQQPTSNTELEDLVASTDTGGRNPGGPIGKFLAGVALVWALFQLWIASPLPYIIGIGVFNDTEARSIHLAFAIFLAFTAFPAGKKSPKDYVPAIDWLLAIVASASAAYLYIFYESLSYRPGNPNEYDIAVACVGIVLLLLATIRCLGAPLAVVALVFLLYCFGGQSMPGILAWKGASFGAVADTQWMSTDGVFGVPLGVSTKFVFLFVLFGALLDKAGAGNYFIKIAFASLGHLRGGPAKAAVVASAMTGLISGSSIANVVTTGTFTIPMMKRVGFSAEKAGAVEVASSVNGQLMPPVMGAAAFLMATSLDMAYFDVVTHAFLPAIISYIALVYIVHLEAMKADLKGLPRRGEPSPLIVFVFKFLFGFGSIAAVGFAVYYGLGWLKPIAGGAASWIVGLLLACVYIGLAKSCSQYPDLEIDDPNAAIVELPELGPTIKSGFHYILPVVVLVWCLMVERLSPALSAFWATALMIVILLTQRPLFAFFRQDSDIKGKMIQGYNELIDGLISGARNMIGIGIATATAGIIVGAVSLTGVGLVLAELVEIMSMGNVMLMLLLTAVLSLILGMGLPTTANYIVVSSLLAPVIVELGQQNGLIVPLIAVHLFVFYFGIMADVTPPVGLASFAAAAVSGGDPIKTGFVAFFYSLRTAALPFLFIFNTDLLLINVTWLEGIFVFIVATVGILVFAASTQGYFFVRNKWYESITLLLIAFTLFRPGYWMDIVSPRFDVVAPAEISEKLKDTPAGEEMRFTVLGENDAGSEREFVILLAVGEGASASDKLESSGLTIVKDDSGNYVVDDIGYESAAQLAGLDFDQQVLKVWVPIEHLPKQLMYIPALLLLGLVVVVQRRRYRKENQQKGSGIASVS